MKSHETDEIIRVYTQKFAKPVDSKIRDIITRLEILCDHFEELGKKDALTRNFAPPFFTDDTELVEIVKLLQQCYREGYASVQQKQQEEENESAVQPYLHQHRYSAHLEHSRRQNNLHGCRSTGFVYAKTCKKGRILLPAQANLCTRRKKDSFL